MTTQYLAIHVAKGNRLDEILGLYSTPTLAMSESEKIVNPRRPLDWLWNEQRHQWWANVTSYGVDEIQILPLTLDFKVEAQKC